MRAWQTSLHAFAQLQSVEQLAQDISQSTPFEAITGITPLMDSLSDTPASELAFEERAKIIFSLDEAAQLHARSYIERFLALGRSAATERRSLWALARGYWATVFDAYVELLAALRADDHAEPQQEVVAQVVVRAIRAAVLRAKWDAFGHSGMDQSIWACLNDGYALAVFRGAEHIPVRPRSDRTTETTAEREYARAMALMSLGLEQLDPMRVELTTSLVHYILPQLVLSDVPSSTSCLWVDVASTMGPNRLLNPPQHPRLPRYLCGASAALSLRSLLELAMNGQLPPGLPLQQRGGVEMLASVIGRMIRIWSNEQAQRLHRRHAMTGQMQVVTGFSAFVTKLLGDATEPQLWQVQDASVKGLGVRVADLGSVRVGSLVGFRATDGNQWCVGVVRRFKRTGWSETSVSEQVTIGVEKIGADPEVALADDGAQPLRIMLLDPLQKNVPIRVLLPVPAPLAKQALYLVGPHGTLKLLPVDTLETGVDFAIRSYLYTV